MKHLKSFNESKTNPIISICHKLKIKNYTINEDGSIDVNGNVHIHNNGYTKLPLTFRNVSGDFICSYNDLESLEGCPKYVGGYFDCRNNEITTLKGGPKRVECEYSCSYNELETLEGCPEYVGGDFKCMNNNLESLEYSPKYVGGSYYFHCNKIVNVNGITDTIGDRIYCLDNPIYSIFELFNDTKDFLRSMDYSYLRGTSIDKARFKEACNEFGIKPPKKIEGYKYI